MNLVDYNDKNTKIGASHLNLIPLCSTICCHVIVLIYWRIIKKAQLCGNFTTENTNKTLFMFVLEKARKREGEEKKECFTQIE